MNQEQKMTPEILMKRIQELESLMPDKDDQYRECMKKMITFMQKVDELCALKTDVQKCMIEMDYYHQQLRALTTEGDSGLIKKCLQYGNIVI